MPTDPEDEVIVHQMLEAYFQHYERGRDPYAHGSEAMKGERDRRTATVRNVFVVYYVAEAALTVTAVRLVPPP
ncbi:hypothetical protein ACFVW2_33445 [Streptomyces sp. NPDC058171]